MSWFRTTIIAAFIVLLFSHAAFADKRVAFVAGNGAYKNVPRLPNPPLDAAAMAKTLRSVGFDVVEAINLSRDAMQEALLTFGKKTAGADVAIFYYAGNAIAVDGTNYLVPVDADLKSDMDLKLGAAINLDLTIDQTMSDAKVRLVFLDACRPNPFVFKKSATRGGADPVGLAEMKSGDGTLIAFAAGPGQFALDGQEGSRSPFTRALIDQIAKPGVEIQQAMTAVRAEVNEDTNKGQLPWGHTNLTGSVYLNSPATPTAAAPGPAANTSASASDTELEFWRSVKASNDPAELNAYITNYPNGQFKALALSRLAQLETNSSPQPTRHLNETVDPATFSDDANQTTEDQIGLDKGQRRDVQRRLTNLGFDAKATGKFDEDTRQVVKRWQAARGYPATGYLNKLQREALQAETAKTATVSSNDDAPEDRPRRKSYGGGGSHRGGSGGGGGSFMGGRIGGLFDAGGNTSPPPRRKPADDTSKPSPDAGDQASAKQDSSLPEFPWPPPSPSTYYVLPDNLLADRLTVGDASNAIVAALERTGYVERTFYRTKPGGVALVTRLERIEQDGTPASPNRWSNPDRGYSSAADIAKFLRGLFFVEPGRFRLIVFVLQQDAFIPSAKEMKEDDARALLKHGANILPPEDAGKTYQGSHCTVLIYEFTSEGSAAHFVAQSPIPAKEHLSRAGILSLLGAKP